MSNDNLKREADELMQKPGKIRGESVLNRIEYIRWQKGEVGVEAILKELKSLGYPLEINKIKPLEWFSDAQGILIILAAQELFGWDKDDIFNMGRNAPKISLMVKMLMKYFVSLEKSFQASHENWQKHHDIGSIDDIQYDKQQNIMSFKLNDYNMHPVMCDYLRGYFTAFAAFIVNSEKISVSEIKCSYSGSAYHQFQFIW